MPTLDPNMLYQIALVLVPLVLAAMHQRGIKLPIIESILDFILKKTPTPAPVNPNVPLPVTPATPAAHPVLDGLLYYLRQRLGSTPLASYSVTPDAADPNKLVVTLTAEAE